MQIDKVIKKVEDTMGDKEVLSLLQVVERGYSDVSRQALSRKREKGLLKSTKIYHGDKETYQITKRNLLEYLNGVKERQL